VQEIRKCCLHDGFFQIVGHQVPLALQERVLQHVKDLFDLPQEEKAKLHKGRLYGWQARSEIANDASRPEHMEQRL
jgi:isopenicillin N synthase-like dioxygenase